jgi:cbb3-type cytochrome oxidase subunit 1
VDWFVRAFLKAGLVWLGLGVTLGVAMAVHPGWVVYRPVHVHMNLLGFVTMTIYGVAYHVIPRFSGHPLHSRRVAAWHVGLANAGLALMVLGFALAPHVGTSATPVLAGGGALAAAGAYAFIYNLWRTMNGTPEARSAAAVHVPGPLARRGPPPAARPATAP